MYLTAVISSMTVRSGSSPSWGRAEETPLQAAPHLPPAPPGRHVFDRRDFFDDRAFRVQPFVGLREVTHLQAAPQLHAALQRRDLAQQRFQERGLPRAVRADERRALLAPPEHLPRAE